MKKVRENPRIYFLLSLNSTIDICLPVLYNICSHEAGHRLVE